MDSDISEKKIDFGSIMYKYILSVFVSFVVLFCMCYSCKANADSSGVQCIITTPTSAEVGETVTISYKFSGGSGKYTNTYISVMGLTFICDGGCPIGDREERELTSPSGTLQFVAPAGDRLGVMISCSDAVTGENFWFNEDFKLTANSNYPITFSMDRNAFFRGETININYNIIGITELVEAKVWWGIGNWDITPELELNSVNIGSHSGIATFSPGYGDVVVCCISGKNKKGIPFYARTEDILLKDVTEAEIQFLPSSLKRIESKAFTGTAFLAVDIPQSVAYIADDAFSDSNVLIIYGSTEYVKKYAYDHDILYKAK